MLLQYHSASRSWIPRSETPAPATSRLTLSDASAPQLARFPNPRGRGGRRRNRRRVGLGRARVGGAYVRRGGRVVRRAHRRHAAAHGSRVDRRAVVAGLDGRDDRDAGLDDRGALTVPSPPRPFVSLALIIHTLTLPRRGLSRVCRSLVASFSSISRQLKRSSRAKRSNYKD